MSEEFEGFKPPEKNFFAMPNCWTDISAGIDSLAELKIIEYVIRHTWGYHEYGIAKTISHDEFMSGRRRRDGSRMDIGTGLSERSVKEGIKRALKDGYLFCEVDTSDKARTKKAYGLKMSPAFQGYNLPPYIMTGVQSTPQMGTIYPPQGEKVPPRGIESTHRSEKDTLERHFEKDTQERERDAPRAQFDENDYHFYGTEKQHLIWNCRNWCAGNHGTCEDYCTAFLSGWREDTPTASKVEAVKPPPVIASTPGEAASPPAATPRQSLSSPVQDGAATTGTGGPPASGKSGPHVETASQAADQQKTPDLVPQSAHEGVTQESIMADWDAVRGQPASRSDRLRKAARELVAARPTREELRGCRDWLPTTDNPKTLWYHRHGVGLWDIAEKLDLYRDHLALSINPAPLADVKQPKPMDIYTAAFLDEERTNHNLEKLRQRHAAREAAAQQQQGGTV